MNFVIWRRAIAAMVLASSLAACGGGGSGSDNGGGSSNAPPRFTSPTSFSFDENTAFSFELSVSDPEGDPVTITVLVGADSSLFSFDPPSGVASSAWGASFDFEQPSDANRDNVYEQIVRLSDGHNTVETTIKVTIVDVDEAPVFTSSSEFNLNEAATGPVFTFKAEDPEGASVSQYKITEVSTWKEISGRLLEAFSIDSSTGVLSVRKPFDVSLDDPNTPLTVVVEASDGNIVGSGSVVVHLIEQPPRVVAGVRLFGPYERWPIGDFASTIGDIDGDGIDEVWINRQVVAMLDQPPLETAYLVWGKTMRELLLDDPSDLDINALTSAQAIRFTHDAYGSTGYEKRSQLVATSASDVDGDGSQDILVGFREMRVDSYLPDVEDGPIAAIVFGDAVKKISNGVYDLLSPPTLGQVNISGVSRRDAFGLSLGGGEFDGDSYGDIVLGSPIETKTRVIFGDAISAAKASGDLDVSLALPGSTILLEHYRDVDYTDMKRAIGDNIASLADITGDGLDELVLSASAITVRDIEVAGGWRSRSGLIVVSGSVLRDAKAAHLSEINVARGPVQTGIVKITGQNAAVGGIATNGDVDADGLADIGVAHINGRGYDRIGTVIFGATIKAAIDAGGGDISMDFTDPSDGVVIHLPDEHKGVEDIWYLPYGSIDYAYADSGREPSVSVAFAPSFADGPGDEFLIGRGSNTPLDRFMAGSVFVFRDQAISGAATANISLSDDASIKSAARVFQGISVRAMFGKTMFVTDFDGDGIVDLSLASPSAGPKASPLSDFHAGAYYILPGSIMQDAFTSDSSGYDLALSLANKTPVQ